MVCMIEGIGWLEGVDAEGYFKVGLICGLPYR